LCCVGRVSEYFGGWEVVAWAYRKCTKRKCACSMKLEPWALKCAWIDRRFSCMPFRVSCSLVHANFDFQALPFAPYASDLVGRRMTLFSGSLGGPFYYKKL
jgi:hypothetical protein